MTLVSVVFIVCGDKSHLYNTIEVYYSEKMTNRKMKKFYVAFLKNKKSYILHLTPCYHIFNKKF